MIEVVKITTSSPAEILCGAQSYWVIRATALGTFTSFQIEDYLYFNESAKGGWTFGQKYADQFASEESARARALSLKLAAV